MGFAHITVAAIIARDHVSARTLALSRSCGALRRERFQRTDSLCRNHAGCIGAGVARAA
jgi:hypothetical protein